MRIFLSVILSSFLCLSANAQNKELKKVEQILLRQAKDWNTGKIENFMNGYWESDQLQFIGSRGVTKGWQKTLDNYKKSYPDKATMGQLSFNILSSEKIGRKAIMMVGKFTLDRQEKENLSGHFLLIWRKIKGEWVIVADHTS